MKFYDRTYELKLLKKADKLKKDKSIMSMVIGRRRVGKTSLLMQNFTDDKKLYFFVSRKSEALLCEEFLEEINMVLGVKPFGEIKKFEQLFAWILDISKRDPLTLVIDEFQEFYRINSSVYSSIQKLWDLNKDSKIHFIACGSTYSLMKKIYEDQKEPLFGRVDFKLEIQPLKVEIIEEILKDFNRFTPENFLDFWTVTGGIPKYIELFVLYKAFSFDEMLENMVHKESLFLNEGKNRLIEEFGKEYTTYFSILSLIASSKTSSSEIDSILEINSSAYLSKLEKDYNIIKSIKPIGAKPNSKIQKYEIIDNFLAFWFRFFYKYQSLIEIESFERLKTIIKRDFSTFKGKFLEKLFIEQLKAKQIYTQIGHYWEKGNKNEIDIVAVDEIDKKLLICEVKLSKKRLNLNKLILKSQKLIQKYKNYKIEYKLLSLEDLTYTI